MFTAFRGLDEFTGLLPPGFIFICIKTLSLDEFLTEITFVFPKPNKTLGQSTGISLVPGSVWRDS